MKNLLLKIKSIHPVWLLTGMALLGIYLYLCFAFNLQFYTEDERYVQLDMTHLASLHQWSMTNYRISSSFGCFIYYPLMSVFKWISNALSYFSNGELTLVLVPMMISKLSHSIMVVAGWLWFSVEIGRLVKWRWKVPAWSAMVCLLFTAMLPVNIFLVKTNNYDSIYNILCLVAGVYLYRFAITGRIRELGGAFFLFALAMQEKFAAYPVFILCLALTPFLMQKDSFPIAVKQTAAVIGMIAAGSLAPSLFRGLAEIFWAADISVFLKHLPEYKPFFTFPKAIGTAKHFLGLDAQVFTIIVKNAFLIHMSGFCAWSALILFIRSRINTSRLKDKQNIYLGVMGGCQILFLLWAFASVWYTIPESGKYPFDTPPPGTYLPPHLSDSHPTFYYGANHVEYIFIRLMKTIGFFKHMVYSPILVLILISPILAIYSLRLQNGKLKTIIVTASGLFNLTMLLVLFVNLTGVPFGNRYANIYLTFIGLSAFLTVLSIFFMIFRGKFNNGGNVLIPSAIIGCMFLFVLELMPYGPSFQVFGNWFYPKKGCGGWGEPTSALIQASRNDPFLKQVIGKTMTTYTGLGIERPFFTPLINLRLIKSRSKQTYGKRRAIEYLLAERTALGQNTVLKEMLETAQKIDGAIIWQWHCRGDSSAWLIDLSKLGIHDYEHRLDPSKFERHYRGEWFF